MDIEQKLQEFSQLKDDWEYPGSVAIPKKVLDQVRDVINFLAEKYKSIPEAIAPVPDGRVDIEYTGSTILITIGDEVGYTTFVEGIIKQESDWENIFGNTNV